MNSGMVNLKLSYKEIVTILNALHTFNDYFVSPNHQADILNLALGIEGQLKDLNMSVLVVDHDYRHSIGKIYEYDDKQVLLIGAANGNGMVRVTDTNLKIYDIPIITLREAE